MRLPRLVGLIQLLRLNRSVMVAAVAASGAVVAGADARRLTLVFMMGEGALICLAAILGSLKP